MHDALEQVNCFIAEAEELLGEDIVNNRESAAFHLLKFGRATLQSATTARINEEAKTKGGATMNNVIPFRSPIEDREMMKLSSVKPWQLMSNQPGAVARFIPELKLPLLIDLVYGGGR